MLKRQLSIKGKVTLAFISLILLPMGLLCGYFYYQTQTHLTTQTINNTKMVLSQIQSNIENKINIVESVSDNIAFNTTLQAFLQEPFQPDGDSINAYSREIVPLVKDGTYYNKVLINYVTLYISLYLTNYSIPEGFGSIWHDKVIQNKEWYQSFLQSNENSKWYSHGGTPFQEQGETGVIYTYIHKINNVNGDYLGLISIDILQKDLYSLLLDSPDGTNAFILDPVRGKFLQQRNEQYGWSTENRLALIREQKNGHFQHNGEHIVYESLESPNVVLGIAVPKASATNSRLIGATLAIIAISAFSLLMFFFVIKKIFVLIKKNILAMDRAIEDGFQPIPSAERKDEFGVIAMKFNILLTKINYMMKENIQKEIVHKDVQLKALQYQINPHFIYNTIDIFSSKMELAGQYEVSDAFSDFGKILRYTINDDSKFVTIGFEMDHLNHYLNLQHMKYGDKLRMDMLIHESLHAHQIMRFILQPLVENSIKHGFTNQEQLTVVINASINDNSDLQISVWDNGSGISDDRLAALNLWFTEFRHHPDQLTHSDHIGLKNINERLCLFYGMQYHLVMESVEGKYTKTIVTIPVEQEE